jgi:hypothetical protein
VFSCTGDNFDISVTLTQSVASIAPGPNGEARASLTQDYTITNNTSPQQIIITKHIDEDMLWGGDATNDLVGADFAELDRVEVYAQDDDLTTGALVLRTVDDLTLDPNTVENSFVYYVGKQNLPAPPGNPDFPGGNCPVHDFGTDTEIWDNFGVPNCWKNFVPGVGYDIPGISPQLSGDSMMGMQVTADLGNGESYNVAFETTYGFRPEPTLTIPPQLTSVTADYDEDGCAVFLWTLRNVNPNVTGEIPVPIDEFYIDVEAGTGAEVCSTMTPPDGWTVDTCGGPDANGHILYRFSGGTPLALGEKVQGRFRVDTNGTEDTINPVTNIAVPALSVTLHAAQGQDEADCSFNFGPAASGEWSIQTTATAYLPVPSLSVWAKALLAVIVIGAGAVLAMRSRKPTVA